MNVYTNNFITMIAENLSRARIYFFLFENNLIKSHSFAWVYDDGCGGWKCLCGPSFLHLFFRICNFLFGMAMQDSFIKKMEFCKFIHHKKRWRILKSMKNIFVYFKSFETIRINFYFLAPTKEVWKISPRISLSSGTIKGEKLCEESKTINYILVIHYVFLFDTKAGGL